MFTPLLSRRCKDDQTFLNFLKTLIASSYWFQCDITVYKNIYFFKNARRLRPVLTLPLRWYSLDEYLYNISQGNITLLNV